MGTIASIVKVLEVLIAAFQYIAGTIDRMQFQKRLDDIDAAVKRAQTGSYEDRLKGGQDVEDNINRD